MKGTGVGRSRKEARRIAEDMLKERLWREVWKECVDLPVKKEKVVEVVDGIFEVEIEI